MSMIHLPDGAHHCTTADLARWDKAVADGKAKTREEAAAANRPKSQPKPKPAKGKE